MGLPWLSWCGKSTTDVSLHRAIGRGLVSCTFFQLGSPQISQGSGTSSPLMQVTAFAQSRCCCQQLFWCCHASMSLCRFSRWSQVPLFSMTSQWLCSASSGNSSHSGWALLAQHHPPTPSMNCDLVIPPGSCSTCSKKSVALRVGLLPLSNHFSQVVP